MRWILVFIVILTCCSGTGAEVLLTEFCPDPYLHDDADEYIVLSGDGSLDGIAISDGKGGFSFSPGSQIRGALTVARSGKAFFQSHGRYPDYEWRDTTGSVPDVISGDTLRLANSHDMILVYRNAILIQNVSWPGDVQPREGQIHYFQDGVWDPRPLMLGQSRFAPAEFTDAAVSTFVSPDSSLQAFTAAVRSANREILLNIYEFASPEIVESLALARGRNVTITVLIEGGPVGGITREEKAALYSLNQSGIPVYTMAPSKGEHAPFRYDHAKYLVIDRQRVLITSENFKASGFPLPGSSGNRGWGVIIDEAGFAGYFASVFMADLHDASVKPWYGMPGDFEVPSSQKHRPEFYPESFSGATVRPVIAPDTSSEILELINSAKSTIEIEQAYITNESDTALNPYLAAAINASRRGVHVRVLLDSYWYNTEDPSDNNEMTTLINTIAQREHLPLEARLADLTTNELEKIHNKGVIVDDRRVLVSSINWNHNSPNFNREAGVIIGHPGAARYFRTVFDDDWNAAIKSPGVPVDHIKIIILMGVIVILLLVYYRRHMR